MRRRRGAKWGKDVNDKPGPGTGAIIAGTFLILFGLCLTLLGGGCSLILAAEPGSLFGPSRYPIAPFFLIALALLCAGLALIWIGVKLMRGGFNK